jgi:hypothetical protein
LASLTTTGLLEPAFSPDIRSYNLFSADSITYVNISSKSNLTECKTTYQSINQSCGDNLLFDVTRLAQNLTIDINVVSDVPVFSSVYDVSIQTAVCEIFAIQPTEFAPDFCRALSPNQTACTVQSSLPVITIVAQVSRFCINATISASQNGSWNPCTAGVCPLTVGTNEFQITYLNSLNESIVTSSSLTIYNRKYPYLITCFVSSLK